MDSSKLGLELSNAISAPTLAPSRPKTNSLWSMAGAKRCKL